jgi:hypothetical protein
LQDKVNKFVAEDLDLDQISLGFGVPEKEKHKAFVCSQMIIGWYHERINWIRLPLRRWQ